MYKNPFVEKYKLEGKMVLKAKDGLSTSLFIVCGCCLKRERNEWGEKVNGMSVEQI